MEKYTQNNLLISGELDDSLVMMNLEKGKYFGLNPVGKRIWELIEQPKNFKEIIAALLAEFEVTEMQCVQEAQAFLDKAVQFEIVKKCEIPS